MIIAKALNRLLSEKLVGLTFRKIEEEKPFKSSCKLHPKYAGKKKPTSKKKECTCLESYEEFKDAKTVVRYEPEARAGEIQLSEEMRNAVMRQLYDIPATENEERSFLSASRVGGCFMKNILNKLGCVPEPLSVRSKLTFMFGDFLESLYIYLLKTQSFSGFKFIEVPEMQDVVICGEKQRGYYDGIVEISINELREAIGKGSDEFWEDLRKKTGKDSVRILFEMKSKSDYGFKSLQRSNKMGYKLQGRGFKRGLVWDDTFGYRSQMGFYIRQAYEDGLIDIPMGVWFVVSKNTGGVLEIYTSLKQLEDSIADAEKNYKIVVDVVRNNKPIPARPYELEDGALPSVPCGYCEQKWSCWSDGVVEKFEKVENASGEIRFNPVYKSEPTQWVEVDFAKGQPVFMVYEKGAESDEEFNEEGEEE